MTGTRRPIEVLAVGVVLLVAAVYIGFGLATASTTLGCDFVAYFNASVHWLRHEPLYDLGTTSTGSCGTFQYPPPFVLLAAPFTFLGFTVGTWAWIAFLIGCWIIGTAILPVSSPTRLAILVLGAVSWPLIFGIRIGQVAPILYLLFAWAWRSLDRPRELGAAVALGTLVKLQPGLLGVWLLLRREWRALAFALVTGVVVTAAAVAAGLRDWIGLFTLLRTLTDAIAQPLNIAIGAVLFQLGASASTAGAFQIVSTAGVVILVAIAALRLPAVPGFLATTVATQLVSPIVWTHYALILLLPVAWLLERRMWWAAAIPLTQAWVLVPYASNWWYTLGFYVTFVALLAVGWRDRRAEATAAQSTGPNFTHTTQPPEPAKARA